jgi:predicted Zn-dependent protease
VGRYSDAGEAVREILSRQPDNAQLLFSCAVLSARAGDVPEALRLLDRLESLQPSFPGMARYRAEWTAAHRPA